MVNICGMVSVFSEQEEKCVYSGNAKYVVFLNLEG